jgi:hypothetical protein
MSCQGHPDQQRADATDDESCPEVVDAHVVAAYDRQVQRLLQHDEREQRERCPDEEAPPPAQPRGVDDHATEQRAADRGEGEGGAEVAGVAASLARHDHRRHHDLHQCHQAADPDALDRAGADQPADPGREPRHRRARDEDDECHLHEHLAAEQVGQLAPHRRGGRGCEQGGRDDPGVRRLAAAQVADDRGQRVGHDRRGQHRDEHADQQAGQRLEHLAVRHRLGGDGRRGDGHGAS